MSKLTRREIGSHDRGTLDDRLARLLDSPRLARVVPALAPEALHRIVRHVGLDASAELVAAATPSQLTSLLDLDLWRQQAHGRDATFDADRFGDWLEALVDAGDGLAARVVASLDPQVVIAGLCRYVRVFDPGTFEPTAQSDDELPDRHELMNSETSGDLPEIEVGGYLVRARRTDAWDAVTVLLVALESGHTDCFHALMRGCRRLSNSTPEVDGLDDLLLAPAQHLHDTSVARDRRRARQGYASPADARAFLRMARQGDSHGDDPIASAYFRDADDGTMEADGAETEAAGDGGHGTPAPDAVQTTDAADPAEIDAVVELLTEVGIVSGRPRALLGAADRTSGAARLPVLTRSMAFLRDHHESLYFTRTRELAFLANVLAAGATVQGRAFTPAEASDAAASICNLGLERWCSSGSAVHGDGEAAHDEACLVDRNLVGAFRSGWSMLYRDVGLYVSDQLIAALDDVTSGDSTLIHDVRSFRRALVEQREAGTPWRARDDADVLTMLDATSAIAVRGLLDECPVVHAALTALLERRTSPVDPTGFRFISSTADIERIHAFARMLPALWR